MSDDVLDSDGAPAAETVVHGIGGAPGIVIGAVHRYHLNAPEVGQTHVDPAEVDTELTLLEEALDRAEQELENVRSIAQDQVGREATALLEAQALMLRDEEVLGEIRRRIEEEHQSAAHALASELREYRRRLEASDDEYLRERADDLEGLETRLLQILQRNRTAATIRPNSIVVTDRLTAADLIRFYRHGMLGCVTTKGGETSHVSIIARALELPAVVGAEGALDAVADRDRVILDGRRGHLIVRPGEETVQMYRRRQSEQQTLLQACTAEARPPTTTADGQTITLRANVEFGETLGGLDQYGAEGIGLMRTEMLFFGEDGMGMNEQRQTEVYRRAAEATGDHGATIRLLDLGGDKLVPFADEEANPFLGWRGIRVLLDREEALLRPQIRALLRANAHGSLRVLLPMVTQLDEVKRVQALLQEEGERLTAQNVEHDADLPVGAMVEVPALALQARQFAQAADFLSIGTNDLTQYVLAVDRGNDRVADRYDALHPAVLYLLRRTVDAGRSTDTPVALCGEVAADLYALPVLLGVGLRCMSMVPRSIPAVRRGISQISLSAAQDLASKAVEAADAPTVRRMAREWCTRHYEEEFRSAIEGE
ncbi:phosphoenolpyruvate--protein phosphotransferase [Salinibacter sp. 10B]|uniref:phosphoenolpyruvate--protein phosphotransferase n=1 Tax=Salinibacter sp. 10B TaxID=1923971 RepID=UPI000D272659|nr:phosphoenolpyruvate--protein phosphotransferase [Salinibacter sp. 10B]PQJ33504.1 phosphoenolpyruvate--protein phosphotransferase [Salinibacter sp. 10B]